jgi:hypothetical protein
MASSSLVNWSAEIVDCLLADEKNLYRVQTLQDVKCLQLGSCKPAFLVNKNELENRQSDLLIMYTIITQVASTCPMHLGRYIVKSFPQGCFIGKAVAWNNPYFLMVLSDCEGLY